MAPLDRASGAVGIEERDAFAALVSAARIGDAVAAGGTKSPAQSLAGGVAIGIERLVEGPGAVSEVMGDKFDIEHDLAKLGGPALRLGGARHEARVVVYGLGERGLEEVSGIEHALVALENGSASWRGGGGEYV